MNGGFCEVAAVRVLGVTGHWPAPVITRVKVAPAFGIVKINCAHHYHSPAEWSKGGFGAGRELRDSANSGTGDRPGHSWRVQGPPVAAKAERELLK
jgi:hypothetical protein